MNESINSRIATVIKSKCLDGVPFKIACDTKDVGNIYCDIALIDDKKLNNGS